MQTQNYTAFEGHNLLATGPLDKVVLKVRQHLKKNSQSPILVFSDLTGKQMDFDLSGTEKETLERLQIYLSEPISPSASGPGRPKLGVVAREISLLPRHWEWLSTQSGGASATIRRLIDEVKKTTSAKDLIIQAQERAYKFMTAVAGDLPGYEEAIRALFAKDKRKFRHEIRGWPKDVVEYLELLSGEVFI